MMNDVINDIAFLAGCNKHRYGHPNHPDLDGWIINQEALDKFAELIVVECADRCTNPLDTEDILEYFGVTLSRTD